MASGQVAHDRMERREDAQLQRMDEPRAAVLCVHVEPLMRPRARGPFALPWLRVAEKVNFEEPFLERALRGEIGEDLEGRARLVLRVVACLDQEQPPLVAQGIRRRNPVAAYREKQQAQPATGRCTMGQLSVKAV